MNALVEAFGYGVRDLEWFTVNAMKSAFLPFDERLALISDVIKPEYAALRGRERGRAGYRGVTTNQSRSQRPKVSPRDSTAPRVTSQARAAGRVVDPRRVVPGAARPRARRAAGTRVADVETAPAGPRRSAGRSRGRTRRRARSSARCQS